MLDRLYDRFPRFYEWFSDKYWRARAWWYLRTHDGKV